MGRDNALRFLRDAKVDWSSDSNEFKTRSIVMWNGNEDEEGLKEFCEEAELIKDTKRN